MEEQKQAFGDELKALQQAQTIALGNLHHQYNQLLMGVKGDMTKLLNYYNGIPTSYSKVIHRVSNELLLTYWKWSIKTLECHGWSKMCFS